MPARRILSFWFPRLAAERQLRHHALAMPGPFAVVETRVNSGYLAALNAEAEAEGLFPGQPLRDARTLCPELVTRPADPVAEAAFLRALGRWAGRFSPWVSVEPPASLMLDVSGCAHLFGGEAALVAEAEAEAGSFGLTLRLGLGDTPGAAWALARHRAGPAIAPPGQGRAALAGLPVSALRLPPDTARSLERLGLATVGDLAALPRAVLARRFGQGLTRRLDQAFGEETEPVGPMAEPPRFAVRLGFPEPIGLPEDIAASVARLVPALAERLSAAGRGARRLRLQAMRSDHRVETVDLGLARATAEPERLLPVLALKLERIDPGLGIDALRLEAPLTEPLAPRQEAARLDGRGGPTPAARIALEDLIGRLGARLGAEAVTRLHPAESHLPERSALTLAAAWSEPAGAWPPPPVPRPLWLIAPEALAGAAERPEPPARLRWRRRSLRLVAAHGPERIAPEWWFDSPEWRSGPRDYWRVETEDGQRLWLYYAHGGVASGGWFCHGSFA
ncbi:MAG: DNA polymerase Y family protein [Paracoccaceae bacterium]